MKVTIDAGHYNKYNQSPCDKDYWESYMTWDLAHYLGEELKRYGIEVVYTRKDQKIDKPVYDRGKCAKGSDLFISLHSNACDSPKVDRVSVFYPFTAREGSKEKEFAIGMGKLISNTMGTKDLSRACTRPSDSGKTEYYGVMRGARDVGLKYYYIVEHSFHTNPEATKWLLDKENLKRLARLEAAYIATFFNVYVPGDVDGDGRVDAFDYFILKEAVLGNAKLNEFQKRNADMNNDGNIDAFDYMILKNKILEDK